MSQPASHIRPVADERQRRQQFPVIGDVARARGVSPQQVTLAWELSLGDHVIPIPGASRPTSIADSAGALTLELSADDLERISAAVLSR